MKKLMVLGLTMAMLMGITACGDNGEKTEKIDETPVVEQTQEEELIAEEFSEVSREETNNQAGYTVEEWDNLDEEEQEEIISKFYEQEFGPQPTKEEQELIEAELRVEEWDNLNEEEQHEIISKFYEQEFGPQPTKEELEIIEAELREEAELYIDNVWGVAQSYLDVLFSDDVEYTEEERISDLVSKGVIDEGSEWNFYGKFYYQEPGATRIYEYTLKDVLYVDEMIEYFGEGNPYSERRNQVGFKIVVDVKDKGALESEVRDSTYTMLMVGPFYDGIFKMNSEW